MVDKVIATPAATTVQRIVTCLVKSLWAQVMCTWVI